MGYRQPETSMKGEKSSRRLLFGRMTAALHSAARTAAAAAALAGLFALYHRANTKRYNCYEYQYNYYIPYICA